MKRRDVLALASGAVALGLAGRGTAMARSGSDLAGSAKPALFGPRLADLNPDRMWPTYRRYYLLIVT